MQFIEQTKEVISGYTPSVIKSLGTTALILTGEIKGFAKNLLIDIADGYLKHEGYGYIKRKPSGQDKDE